MIELMIVLVIVAAVVTLTAPAFEEVRLSVRLRAAANSMVSSLYQARGEAIKRNTNIRLCKADGDGACVTGGGWEQGWLVLDPNDAVISRQRALASGYVFASVPSTDEIEFSADGFMTPGLVELTACRQTPTAGSHEKVVTVAASGSTGVERTETGSCP